MADQVGFVQQQSVSRHSDGTSRGIRITRDGSVIQVPWLQALCLEGRMFGAQCGDATTDPVGAGTFGAGSVSLVEFDYFHVIPVNTTILPVYMSVAFLAVGTAAEAGIHVVWGSGGVAGTSITLVPFNMRPSSSNSTNCTVTALDDGDGTIIVVAGVIYEQVTTALTGVAGTSQQYVPEFSVTKCGYVPVLEGAVQLAMYANGQASTGYLTSMWAELPSSAIS
ncbi:hypothetical protein LCGC14_0310700 [marine sediment metagenome]|uniref:Uncharacterized protein n=1 Tax=marine sediment metagenome TaxID=412755 RepID=A0A0F9U4N3_9ZZZZ